jgi:hypothetical protein
VSRPLRSTATPASSGFSATTGRSASERRLGTQCLPVSAVGTLPLATRIILLPGRRIDARLLTFRARAADQAHAASTPDTTWPGTREPARPIPRDTPEPSVSMPSARVSTPQQRTPSRHRPSASGTSSWSPPDAITPRLFPERSPRQSSANAAPGRFDAYPRRVDAGGPAILHLSHSSAYVRVIYTAPPSAFVTHGAALLKGPSATEPKAANVP